LRAGASRADEEAPTARFTNPRDDFAFYGPFSLINTDQGVRGYLQVVNDLCYLQASAFKLNRWIPDESAPADLANAVDRALETLNKQDFAQSVVKIGKSLASFDWRTSSAPDLDDVTRRAKLVYRGSSGYKELRTQLLEHLGEGQGAIAEAAKRLRRGL
jgi:DNA-binding transcriptional MocR family regulator